MCRICGGKGYIRLPLETEARYVTLDDAPTMEDSYKEYLCPECQPVFYLSDLEQLHQGGLYPTTLTANEVYREGAFGYFARKLGSMLPQFARNVVKEDTGHMSALQSTVWVLRKEAHKKIYRR